MTTQTLINPENTETSSPNPWENVAQSDWNDWKWQLSNRLNSVDDFSSFINLTPEERAGLSANGLFRVEVTPYFASLLDPDDAFDPLRMQVMPLAREMDSYGASMVDSLAEDAHSPVPGLVHR